MPLFAKAGATPAWELFVGASKTLGQAALRASKVFGLRVWGSGV